MGDGDKLFLLYGRSAMQRMQGHSKAPGNKSEAFDWNSLIGDPSHDDELYQRSMGDIEQVWVDTRQPFYHSVLK